MEIFSSSLIGLIVCICLPCHVLIICLNKQIIGSIPPVEAHLETGLGKINTYAKGSKEGAWFDSLDPGLAHECSACPCMEPILCVVS